MKKPEKRYDNPKQIGNNNRGYNQALDDCENYYKPIIAKLETALEEIQHHGEYKETFLIASEALEELDGER